MVNDGFDVIVVGAGIGGLCCAGELVLRGARPLLICESQEVGWNFRSLMVGNNRALMQQPTRNLGGEGGWWFGLVRRLNLPIRLHRRFDGLLASMEGTGVVNELPTSVSAATLTDAIAEFSPLPIDESRGEFERVLHAGLNIPHEELVKMHQVPLAVWLEEQKADAFVSMIMLTLGANIVELNIEQATQHLSVLGCFGVLRNYVCGDAELCQIAPDAREGLCVPIALEVERRGGAVWRGRRVAKVLIADGRASGVVLEDGTEVCAPIVALAGATGRIGSLLDPLPPEVEGPLAYESVLNEHREYITFSLLDNPAVDKYPRKALLVVKPDGSQSQVNWSVNSIAPWTTEPGKVLLATEVVRPRKEVAEMGGEEVLFAHMRETTEEFYPGYKDAIVEIGSQTHNQWMTPFLVGPKLPRTIDSVDGLWFVGEGSEPIGGLYIEAAASAGILGARAMGRGAAD